MRKLQTLISDSYPNQKLNTSDDHIKTVLNWAVSRITTIEDLVTNKFGFLWILSTNEDIKLDKKLLDKLINNLQSIETFDQNSIKENLKLFSKDNNMKFPELMKMLRTVLSGLNEGPGVAEMMHLLGKDQSLERIKAVAR